jgi:hypothetical protein
MYTSCVTSTPSWLLSSILHDSPCLKQRTSTTTKSWIGANTQNTFLECTTMWNETELDQIVFSLPTPPLAIRWWGWRHKPWSGTSSSSLLVDGGWWRPSTQLPWDHHNGSMPRLTQRTAQMFFISLLPTRQGLVLKLVAQQMCEIY